MQNEFNVKYRTNMETIMNFTENNPYACIKADTSGNLFSMTGSYFSRSVGYFSGTDLKGTASIINDTCLNIVKELNDTLHRAENSTELKDSSEACELYAEAEKTLKGLKTIYSVYSKRYEGVEHQGLQDLAESIQQFENTCKDFEKRQNNLVQKIEVATLQIFAEAEQNAEMSFLHIPEAVEPNKAFSGIEDQEQQDQAPKISTWWSTYGQGPTMLGQLVSGLTTAKEIVVGTIAPHEYKASSNPAESAAQQRVANVGRQLGGADVHNYIQGIQKETPVNTINSFYLMSGSSINNKSLEDIKKIIDLHKENFPNPDLPVAIPLVFSGEGIYERNHIAVILVKDNCVEYYDAKGIFSENKTLTDGSGTLHDVLEHCKKTFTKEGTIAENPYVHQFDSHNCGVFVCHHLHDRLINKTPMATKQINATSISDIENFRLEILERAYPKKEENELEDSQKLMSSGDDF